MKNLFDKKLIVQSLIAVVLLVGIYIINYFGVRLEWYFCISLGVIYLSMMPKKLMNPKNFVFVYYFVFYGVAPLVANRYANMYEVYGSLVNKAYVLCFTTYAISMTTLNICLNRCEEKLKGTEQEQRVLSEKKNVLSNIDRIVYFLLLVVGLVIYIQKTGGLERWLTNPDAAFFSRRGSGLYYLMFTNMLMILLFLDNQNKLKTKKDIAKRVSYIVLLLGLSIFIGSRSTTFIMVLMLFSYTIMQLNLINAKSIGLVGIGAGIFIAGMYIRQDHLMTTLAQTIATFFDYFDTFKNLLISLKDFPPAFGLTVLLPFNWILMKFGVYIGVPYHDMSIWLTDTYYPDSWAVGGTTQWPIETDMYLSFMYYGGIPLVVLYFVVIAYLYRRAQEKGVWRFIYINEAMMIISHLRGGIFIFWYFWLIPLYLWLIFRYDKKRN